MQNVKVIADSTCDLGAELIRRYDIDIAPLYVTLGDATYRDGVDVTADEVLAFCERTKSTPKTAATSVGDFVEMFRPYADSGRDIVFLGISSSMSAEVQNARLAAAEFPNRVIRCIDTMSLSTGVGLLVIEAAERAAGGMGANRIADEVEALLPKVSASFVLDTLTNLHRGGRCSGLTAFGAAMFQIKPEISVIGGHMAPTAKYRGKIGRAVRKYLDKQLASAERIRPKRVFLTYSSFSDEEVAAYAEVVRQLGYFEEVFTTRAGSVITSHCGPYTLGILFIEK